MPTDDEWSAPKYAQIVKAIRDRINDGTYAPGAQIPSETALIREYGVSRPTVVRALQTLQLRGFIDRVHGKGTYVKTSDETGPQGPGSEARWKPGDIVIDRDGSIWQRSAHPKRVWEEGAKQARLTQGPYIPEGAVEEDEAVRPLTLLVRDGYPVRP